jgi:hypothetical protein
LKTLNHTVLKIDLVRQLIYDFRTWNSLEGLGRSGSDEGFDVRGIQIIEDPGSVD